MLTKKFEFSKTGAKNAENALHATLKQICDARYGHYRKKDVRFEMVTPEKLTNPESSAGEMVSRVFYNNELVAIHYYKFADKITVEILEAKEEYKPKEFDPYEIIFPNYNKPNEKELKELRAMIAKFPANSIEEIKRLLIEKALYIEIKKTPF
jgi:hypothetical protein